MDTKALHKLIEPTDNLKSKISKSDIKIDFNVQDDKTQSWDSIFDIKSRYFERISSNRIGWFNKVDKHYKKYKEKINNYTVENAFNNLIEDDSDDQLGFLKAPYLESLKSNAHLVKAIREVSGSSQING